jgi:FAD/FMN-containing dehydrogenase
MDRGTRSTTPSGPRQEHERRRASLAAVLAAARGSGRGATVGLAKDTSNLFRDREAGGRRLLDVRGFDHVLAVDAEAGRVEAEGMATYAAIVDATLQAGTMPAVVPQLATITLGGAAAGVGIEATSFREGLVHETLAEFDVLTGTGDIVRCRPDNEHADLFHGFPNSYGTLGYALRLVARTRPVRPFVAVTHRRFGDAARFLDAVEAACDGDADFVDGVVFDRGTLVLTEGRFADEAPATSDYTFENVYYRSLLARERDWLTVRDWLWRWDTDWFWCSRNVGAQHPLLRRLYGRSRLNSRTYQRIMRWNARLGLTRALDRLRGGHAEPVIQDVDIPVASAGRFLAFLLDEIAILPIWTCPITPSPAAGRFALYPMTPSARYVNFGFWDVLRRRERHPPGHFNRRIEVMVAECGGIKSLYSDSYFAREDFDRIYGGAAYRALKARYDPQGVFPELYDKCVGRRGAS